MAVNLSSWSNQKGNTGAYQPVIHLLQVQQRIHTASEGFDVHV